MPKGKVLSLVSSPSCGCFDCTGCLSVGELEVRLTDDDQIVSVPYSHLGSMGQKAVGDVVEVSLSENGYELAD